MDLHTMYFLSLNMLLLIFQDDFPPFFYASITFMIKSDIFLGLFLSLFLICTWLQVSLMTHWKL